MTCNGLNGQGDTRLRLREQIEYYKAFHDDSRAEIRSIGRPESSLAPNDITLTFRFYDFYKPVCPNMTIESSCITRP